MTELELSIAIEDLLVARNLRQMRLAQQALAPGYYLRAATLLRNVSGSVLIGTGFPVSDTFETDGPVGAIALYDALESLGASPWLACAPPLSSELCDDYNVLELQARDIEAAREEARACLAELQPSAIVSIERPGLCADEHYYNMRGEDITARCAFFDPFLQLASCPTVAIGDGGNEIGMGNILPALEALDIHPSTTTCDELLVADVSNWGAYGILAFLSRWAERDLLQDVSPADILEYLSAKGSVDGVTRENTLTEDGLVAEEGYAVIQDLRRLAGLADGTAQGVRDEQG